MTPKIPDAAQRFIGVPSSADPMTLLGLTADRCDLPSIDAALRDRLSRIFQHPEGRSADAEEVRKLLRDAADRLRRRGRSTAPNTASVPSGARMAASSSVTPTTLHLTEFDRQVLAVLIASGGWNHESRERLVAISARHGIGVDGLLRVIRGLGEHARGGGRLGMQEISAGARMVPLRAGTAPGIPDGAPVLEKLAGALAEEIRRDDPSTVIRLCVLFGLITLMAGIFGLRLLLASDKSPPVRRDSEVVAQTQAEIGDPVGANPATSQPQRLAMFPKAPGFLGNGLPAESMKAVDECPELPAHLDEVGRKLAITETPSEAVFVSWEVSLRTISAAWVLVDESTRLAIDKAIFESLRNAAGQPQVIERLLKPLIPPSAPSQPLDLWRGSWQAGMLAKFAAATTLPPAVISRARALLDTTLSDPPLVDVSFDAAARAWLDRRVPGLVDRIETDEHTYDWWELWLVAHRTLGRSEHFDRSLLAALTSLAATETDLAKPGRTVNILARLFSLVLEQPSPTVLDHMKRMLTDEAFASRDLWVLTSLLAMNDEATWFPDRLVVPEDADLRHRGRILDELISIWPGGTEEANPQAESERVVLQIDAVVGRRWRESVDALPELDVVGSNLDRMRDLVRLSRLNAAAAALAASDAAMAERILDAIESGLEAAVASTERLSPTALPFHPTGTVYLSSRQPPPSGQAIGQDGVWALAYEDLGKKTKERLESLQSLRNAAGSDLGPIDAQLFVHEVYRGSPTEIRSMSQTIVAQQFPTGPVVAMEMLDQFPDAPKNAMVSQAIERLTGSLLPQADQPEWPAQARLALVKHVLELKPDGQVEIDALAKLLAQSFAQQAAILQQVPEAIVTAATPQVAAEALLQNWRSLAELFVVESPTSESPAELQRRHAMRLRVAQGPIQGTIAAQLGVMDVLAAIVIAEQPNQRQRVDEMLREDLRRRSRVSKVLEQSVRIERTLLALWNIRFGGQSDVRPEAVPAAIARDEPAWRDRLEALRRQNPLEYFELAEEVADDVDDPSNRVLARHLYSLAAALDPVSLGRSSCLALADLAEDENSKRRLRALASLLGDDGEFAPALSDSAASNALARFDQATIMAFTEAISRYRKGQGALAATSLDKPGVKELLQVCDRLLPGGQSRFLEDIKRYRGQARPTLSASDQLRLLQLEAALLAGTDRSWSGELLINQGTPLIEIDPNRLADSLEIDVSRPHYRQGSWIP